MKEPAIYIVANKKNGTLYTGVTSNLAQRMIQHKKSLIQGFSKKYGCTKLVYYEVFETMFDAISREKQIKAKKRKNKVEIIESKNPEWNDLYEILFK